MLYARRHPLTLHCTALHTCYLINFQMTNKSQLSRSLILFRKNVQKCVKLELEKHIKVVQTG